MQETNVSLRHCSTNQQCIFLLVLHLKTIWSSIGKETLKEIKQDAKQLINILKTTKQTEHHSKLNFSCRGLNYFF